MLTKFCPFPGCREIIPANERYCERHMKLYMERQRQNEAERQKRYDTTIRHVRDAEITDFYHSPEWLKLRALILAKYKGLDLWSYFMEQRIVKAEMVHHIKSVRTDWDDRFSIGNLVPLSESNHGMIEQLYRTGRIKDTQRQLFGLLAAWKKEFGG